MEIQADDITNEDIGKEIDAEKKPDVVDKKVYDNVTKSYKAKEAESNQLKSAFGKLKSELESKGIGKFDDNMNLVLNDLSANVDIQTDKVAEIDEQIKQLKTDKNNGDIDDDDYIDRLSDLKSAKTVTEYDIRKTKEQAEQHVIQQNNQSSDNVKAEQNKVLSFLDANYPEHNIEGSLLHSEMSKLYTANQDVYAGVDLSDPANLRMRLVLTKQANESLQDKGVVPKSNNMSNFDTLQNKGGVSQQPKGMSAESRIMLETHFDKKTIDQINKQAMNLNSGKDFTINF